jgi:hypothetical protein
MAESQWVVSNFEASGEHEARGMWIELPTAQIKGAILTIEQIEMGIEFLRKNRQFTLGSVKHGSYGAA